jgi:hypothetical protein
MFNVLNPVILLGTMVITGILFHMALSVANTLRPFFVKASIAKQCLLLFQFVKGAVCVVKFIVLQLILCHYHF